MTRLVLFEYNKKQIKMLFVFNNSIKSTFEIEGKNKTRKQIVAIPDSDIAKDIIEIGV